MIKQPVAARGEAFRFVTFGVGLLCFFVAGYKMREHFDPRREAGDL